MSFDPLVLAVIPVFVLSVIVHECAHGVAALWQGDTTARDLGRLTLNPLPHLDLLGSIVLPGALMLMHSPLLFGWAKPVPINAANLRQPRDGMVGVALAGPASNALLALAFGALARLAPEQGLLSPLRDMGYVGVIFNCALGLFNLIPIPPLDGSWVLMRFLPLRHVIALRAFRFAGMALVALLLWSPVTSGPLFHAPLRAVVHACLRLYGLPAEGLPL